MSNTDHKQTQGWLASLKRLTHPWKKEPPPDQQQQQETNKTTTTTTTTTLMKNETSSSPTSNIQHKHKKQKTKQQQLEEIAELKTKTTTTLSTATPTSSTNTQQLKVITATACCPKKPNKAKETKERKDCGEDAVFVARNFPDCVDFDEMRVCAIGIADGVGSYALRGVDPSVMAWAMMDGIKAVIEQDHKTTCIEALTQAYDNIVKTKSVDVGASTACVISFSTGVDVLGNKVLKLTGANIGDSSFMVIRDGVMLYRTKEQTHGFNCPYQLAVPRNDATSVHDDPCSAETLSAPLDLIKGDVVIVATDGLTDNVFDSTVVQIVSKPRQGSDQDIAAKIASDLLKIAYVSSRSRDAVTPFSKYAEEYNLKHVGGKVDDVTFVVALIS
jgi:protein phosphatase PTC7